MPAFQDIAEGLASLTSKQRSIAEFILARPEHAAALTLRELSTQAGASEVSVLRMCSSLGFDGYTGLRQELMKYTQSAFRSVKAAEEGIGPSLSRKLRDVCAADIKNLTDMIGGLDEEKLFACARGLLAAGEVFVFAHDASTIISEYLCYRLNFLRIKTTNVKLGDVDTMQSLLARLKKTDYAILFSFPPYHAPMTNVVNYCRYREVPMLTITDSPSSPAAGEDCSVFLCGTTARYFYNSQAATVSFINILASCTAMAMGRGFDEILAAEQDVGDFLRGGYSAGEDE